MHPQGHIRKLSTEDINGIYELDKNFYFDKARIWPKEVYQNMLNDKNFISYVYEVNREIWAYAVFKQCDEDIDAIKLISRPNGMMFAKKLVLECMDEFKKEGFIRMLGTCPDNLVKYYMELGGKVIGIRPHAIGIDIHANILEIIL